MRRHRWLGTRTPVAIAQAALTLTEMSQGRFSLGLGSSGPQVIEGGWLGTSFVPEGAAAYFEPLTEGSLPGHPPFVASPVSAFTAR